MSCLRDNCLDDDTKISLDEATAAYDRAREYTYKQKPEAAAKLGYT